MTPTNGIELRQHYADVRKRLGIPNPKTKNVFHAVMAQRKKREETQRLHAKAVRRFRDAPDNPIMAGCPLTEPDVRAAVETILTGRSSTWREVESGVRTPEASGVRVLLVLLLQKVGYLRSEISRIIKKPYATVHHMAEKNAGKFDADDCYLSAIACVKHKIELTEKTSD